MTNAAGTRPRRAAVVGLAAVALLPVGLVAGAPAQADTGPGANGRIAYERFVEYDPPEGLPYSDSEIFSSLPDGTDEVNLTNTEHGNEIEPAWSPDGTRLAFASDRDGNYEIHTMAADGTDVRQVTFLPDGGARDYVHSFQPTWSPDGTQIAFTGYRPDPGNAQVYIAPVDATEDTYTERLLTEFGDFGLEAAEPDWSPDGLSMAYVQYYDQFSTDIVTMDIDGTGGANLTENAGEDVSDWYPAWSPDGTRITWVSNRDAEDPLGVETDVYVMPADGTGVARATNDPTVEYDPTFSPDGLQILYQTNYYDPEIWVVEAPPPPGGATATDDARRPRPVRVGAGGAPSWQRVSGAQACTITGTAEADVLTGTGGRDVICGRGGNDTISGLGGRDRLLGGSGADTLTGGGRNDVLKGGRGADLRDGGRGLDRCDTRDDTAAGVSCER